MKDVFITGLGAFLPGDPVDNGAMEEYLGLVFGKKSRHRAAALRQNRIQNRHYALDKTGKPLHSSASMAARAIQAAIEASEATPRDIGYLAASATLGDGLVPGLASHIHAALGWDQPVEIANFSSVCASALMALKGALLQLRGGEHSGAVVSGSEFSSRYFRPGQFEQVASYRATGAVPAEADFLRFTLSDGAGAALLQTRPNARQLSLKIQWIALQSFAHRFAPCMTGGMVSQQDDWRGWGDFGDPLAAVAAGALVLRQDFALLERMLPVWVAHYLELIEQGRIVPEKIDHVCSHFSSHALWDAMTALLRRAGAMIDESKWFTNLYTKGNTGTAAIFIILEELYRSGKLQRGQNILCHVPESGRCLNGFMLLEVV